MKALKKQEQDIAYISLRLRQLKAENNKLQSQLVELNQQATQQSRALESQKQTLIKQLRSVYRQGRQPALKLLLDNNEPQDAARYLHYFQYLSRDQEQRIKQFKQDIAALENTEQSILSSQRDLEKNRVRLSEQLTELKQKRSTRRKKFWPSWNKS